MKALLFILIVPSLYGQKLIKSDYEKRMEAKAISKFSTTMMRPIKEKEHIMELMPLRWVKITLKTGVNQSGISTIIENGIGGTIDELSMDDYSTLGKYDLRFKFYLSKKIRLLNRITGSGINNKGLGFSSGFIIKFK